MSVVDSESRRFEANIRLSFSQADLGPTSAPELFFSSFCESLVLYVLSTLRFKKRAHSNPSLKNSDGYLWNSNFSWEFCVSIGIGLT